MRVGPDSQPVPLFGLQRSRKGSSRWSPLLMRPPATATGEPSGHILDVPGHAAMGRASLKSLPNERVS